MLLFQKDYQTFFINLVSQPPLLFEELVRNPSLAAQLASFVKAGHKSGEELQNEQVSEFFLDLNRYFSASVQHIAKKSQVSFPELEFLDTRKELLKQIERHKGNPENQSLYWLDLALLTPPDALTEESATDFLSAYIHLTISPIPKDHPFYRISEEVRMRDWPVRFQGLLREPLATPAKDRILNAVCKSIYPNLEANFEWITTPEFPHFATSDGSIYINAAKGQIFRQGLPTTVLPIWCRENAILKPFIVEGAAIQLEELNSSGYQILQWTGPNSLKIRIYKRDQDITIQREIEPEVWAEYSSDRPKEISRGLLLPNRQIWIEQTSDKNFIWETDLSGNYLRSFYLQKIWVADFSGAILYSMQYVKDLISNQYFSKITKPLLSGEEWTLVPVSADCSIAKIENPDFVLVWQDSNKKTVSVELPRYNLTFLDQGRGLQTEQIPGLSLQNTAHPSSAFFPSLVLKGAGKTRRLFLNPLYDSSPVFQKSGKNFFLIKETKGKLEPVGLEDHFFLCLLHLQEHQYSEAFAMLSLEKSQLQKYTEEEKILLSWIVQPSKTNLKEKDFSPASVAIRLRALYMLKRNEIDFHSAPDVFDPEIIQNLTMFYLQYIEEIPLELRFSSEEELLLLTSLDPRNPLAGLKRKQLQNQSVERNEGLILPNLGNPKPALSDNFFCFSSYKLQEAQRSTSDHSLLRRTGLLSNFSHLLRLASKNPPDEQSYRTLYRELIGENPEDDLTVQQLSQPIVKALTLIARSRTSDEERRIALILLAAMQYPESFQRPAAFVEECLADDKYVFRNGRNEKDSCNCDKLRTRDGYDPMIMPTRAIAATIYDSFALPVIAEADPLPLKAPLPEFFPYALVEQTDFIPYDLSPPNGTILEDKNDSQGASQDLTTLFAFPCPDPSIRSHMSRLSQRLSSFSSEPRPRYSVKNQQMFVEWKNSTKASILELDRETEITRAELLLMANEPFADPARRALHKAELVSGQKKPITLPELLELYTHSHASLLIQKNPALDRDKAEAILKKTHVFLLRATYLQHLHRLFNSMEEMQSLRSSQEISLGLEEILTIAKAQRKYDPNIHPQKLVFEFFKNILIWDKQISALGKLKQDGLALEEIMGGGKTSVLLPLSALEDADGKTLSTVIMPEALIPSVTKQLRPTFHFLLTWMEIIEIDRNTILDEFHLKRLHQRLEQAIKNRKVAVLSSTSFQSLILRCIEALDRPMKPGEKKLWQQIFGMLLKNGSLKMDEMDLLLDVLKAHHFTQGEKSSIHMDLLDASTHFYEILLTHPDLKGKIRWNFLPSKGGLHPLTEETFDALRPLLIEKLLSSELSPDQESKKFFSGLPRSERKLLTLYLQGTNDEEVQRFYENISSVRVKNLLSVWKEEVKSLLLLTGKKHVGEHYGQDPSVTEFKQKNLMAIPYHGNENPAIGSQPGTDIEILHYTIQMYLHRGLSLDLIELEIKRLQEAVHKEFTRKKKTDIKQTSYYKEFLRLTGGREDFQLFQLQPHQLEHIQSHVNQNPALLLKLTRRHVLPQLETYPSELHTNAHVMEAFFRSKKVGFSGTFWNEKSYPPSFSHKELSNTEEKTLHLLWEQKTPVSILPKSASLKEQIESIYHTHRGSIADLGGVFRGFDSEEVARTIIKLPIWKKTKILGIAFYDSQGQRKILLKDSLTAVSFEQSGLAKEEIIAYWSQRYTTGSDIPLGLDMTTVVTVGEHTIMRDLLQAVWRNRKLHRGQRISITVPSQEADIIRKALTQIGYFAKDPLCLADIFFYVKYNEALRQADYNLRGLRFNMENVLIARLFEQFTIADDLEALKAPLKELFSQDKPKEPYLQYGSLDKTLPGEGIAKLEISRLKQTKAFQFFSPSEQKEIEKVWEELTNSVKNHLPKEASTSMTFGTEKAVEAEIGKQVEQEIEKEAEIQKETQIENFSDLLNLGFRPKGVYIWKETNLFTKEYFSPKSNGTPPDGARVIPDFEWMNWPHHPMDRLAVTGPDLLAEAGIRPLRYLEEWGDHLLISLNADSSQKMKFFLLIQGKATKKLETMLLNDWDALMFRRLLMKDKTEPQQGVREVQLALYHTDLGCIGQGADPIDPATENSSEFISLKVRIKFLNGETDYSEEELPVLKEWIEQKGVSKMKTLFLNEILKNKQESALAYPGSSLEAIFS